EVSGIRSSLNSPRHLEPGSLRLPEGMRVDGCIVQATNARAETESEFTISVSYDVNPGYSVGPSSGQWLEAFAVEGPCLSGAFGIRDDDWWAGQRGVVRAVPEGLGLLRLQVASAISIEIELSVAWIFEPNNESEQLSPWFAADLVMKS
ncbi:MAG: hypothetical protein AAFQ67_02720, partial [Pseudomonadota bacterium]